MNRVRVLPSKFRDFGLLNEYECLTDFFKKA